MVEDAGLLATSVFESVAQDGHVVEGSIVVDGPGDLDHATFVPGPVRGVKGDRAERVTNDFA
jgi:hypothetical protein